MHECKHFVLHRGRAFSQAVDLAMTFVMAKRRAKSKSSPIAAAKPGIPKEAALAFADAQPSWAALSTQNLRAINVDIPSAVAIAIGAIPRLGELREAAAKLPDYDVSCIDRLGTFALAAWYAHLLALPEVASSQLAALLEEAKPLREDMLLAAELLAHKGYFDRRSVAAIRAGSGNLDTANDLVALAALFSAAWARVENRTTVEKPDVVRASTLGPEILIAMGARDRPASDGLSPAEVRARAFTLFANAYDQCRRAAGYLRWNQKDAGDYAPSLRPLRGPRRGGGGGAEPEPEPEPEPEDGEDPEPEDGGGPEGPPQA